MHMNDQIPGGDEPQNDLNAGEIIPESAPHYIQESSEDDEILDPDGWFRLATYAQKAYLSYAMSVVKGRALPDVSDGNKPVMRRILYAMHKLGLTSTSKPVKSARVVGDVIGKFHPHGDQSVYDAAVRVAQEFSLRHPLIDGQGNFGSRDGDGAAAMRYTEMRLTPIAEMLLSEIDRGPVEFIPNYDGTGVEPRLLPARLPMILLNGAYGIAVGMATSIPSHNLREVVDATLLLIKNPEATLDEVLSVLPGPDYPGGGQIISSAKTIRDAYDTGRGSVRMRCVWRKEDLARGQYRIVINQHPHGVSTASVLKEIETGTNPQIKEGKKELSQDQKNIKALLLSVLDKASDESDNEQPVRLVLEPKTSKISPDELMAAVFAHTSLEASVSINMTMIGRNGNPQPKGVISILREWIDFRYEAVDRRIRHRLVEVRDRIHILDGRLLAFLHIDEVIRIIRESADPKEGLMSAIGLSETQAEDILEIRLRQLARMEGIKIQQEADDLRAEELTLQGQLDDRLKFIAQVVSELQSDKKKFGDDRRTLIEPVEVLQVTKTIPDEATTLFISANGWVRAKTGHGIDKASMPWKQGDKEGWIIETRTVNPLIVLDDKGQVYSVDVSDIPTGKAESPLNTMIQLVDGGKPVHIFSDELTSSYLFTNSASFGFITQVANLVGRSRSGKKFLTLEGNETILKPVRVSDMNHWVAACSHGPKEARMVLFQANEMKVMPKGRGVIVMNIDADERLSAVSVIAADPPTIVTLETNLGQKVALKDLNRFLLKRARKGCQVGKKVEVTHVA